MIKIRNLFLCEPNQKKWVKLFATSKGNNVGI